MVARRYAVPRCTRERRLMLLLLLCEDVTRKERKKEKDTGRPAKGRAMAMAAEGCKACLLCTGKVETLENGCQEPSVFVISSH